MTNTQNQRPIFRNVKPIIICIIHQCKLPAFSSSTKDPSPIRPQVKMKHVSYMSTHLSIDNTQQRSRRSQFFVGSPATHAVHCVSTEVMQLNVLSAMKEDGAALASLLCDACYFASVVGMQIYWRRMTWHRMTWRLGRQGTLGLGW